MEEASIKDHQVNVVFLVNTRRGLAAGVEENMNVSHQIVANAWKSIASKTTLRTYNSSSGFLLQ